MERRLRQVGWIYRYEAKGIQAFITQTDKLKEIKGGSRLVERLSKLRELAFNALSLNDQQVIAEAAGSATIRFDTWEKMDDFKSLWPLLVDRFASGLEVIQAAVEESSSPGEATKALQAELRVARNRQSRVLPEAGPVVFRAPRTGLPALPFDPKVRELQDRALQKRHKAAGDENTRDILGQKLDEDLKYALDLSTDVPGTYLAVVHADGNDLGARIQNLDIEELRELSQALSDATLEAAKAALSSVKEELTKSLSRKGRVAFRPIVLGGDDLTVIIRADLALPFTKEYLKAFEEETNKRKQELSGPATACAGIAFVHNGYPFHKAHHLAEQLCSYSKDVLRKKGPSVRGCPLTASGMTWHRVSTSLCGDFKSEIVRKELDSKEDPPKRSLLNGPYTIESINGYPKPKVDDLDELSSIMAKLPSGPLRSVIGLMRDDPNRAKDKLKRLERVCKDEKAYLAFEESLQNLGCDTCGWRNGGDKERSPMLDAWIVHNIKSEFQSL